MSASARALPPLPDAPRARWWRFVDEHRLVCPAGHHIPRSTIVNETGFIRCDKRVDAPRAELTITPISPLLPP